MNLTNAGLQIALALSNDTPNIAISLSGGEGLPLELLPMGPPGPSGATWLFGSGFPDNGGGRINDMYLQDNGNVWHKQIGGWVFTGINLNNEPVGERRHEWDNAAKISYAGVAPIDTADAQPLWRITRVAVAANGSTVKTVAYPVAWSDRLTAIYV